MSNINLSLNDERWCTECGNFVMPEVDTDTDETGKETIYINCPNCGKGFEVL